MPSQQCERCTHECCVDCAVLCGGGLLCRDCVSDEEYKIEQRANDAALVKAPRLESVASPSSIADRRGDA